MLLPLGDINGQLLLSTTRVEAISATGALLQTGTGFFFHFTFGSDSLLALVTVRHLLRDADRIRLSLHPSTDGHNTLDLDLPPIQPHIEVNDAWVRHPVEDLCAVSLEPVLARLSKNGTKPLLVTFNANLIPEKGELEELFVCCSVMLIGYPNGLWDEKHSLPLIRRGVTASHPAIDFDGAAQGVLDIATIGGSSGSPVLLCDIGGYGTSKGLVIGNRLKFLGVLFAGPNLSAEVTVRAHHKDELITRIPIHLGYYVKSREVLTLGSDLFAKKLL